MASRIYPLQKSDSDGIMVCPFQQQLIPHHVVM